MDTQITRQEAVAEPMAVTVEDRIDIIDDAIRKKYLARLSDMDVVPIGDLPPLEEDVIDNVRLYRIDEMVYQKGEPVTDKFTTVFNTLSTYNASAFVLVDSDGKETRFYLGVRNNEPDESPTKRSTVTLGDTLSQTLVGHFPGVRIRNEDRKSIVRLAQKVESLGSVASVSVVGNNKIVGEQTNERFVQGLEKLVLAMSGRAYTGVLIAENQSPQDVQLMRKQCQDLYTKLSRFQQTQLSESTSTSSSRSKSFAEMDGKQKAAMIAGAAVSLAGVVGGATAGAGSAAIGLTGGAMIGGQVAGQLGGFINSLAPVEQISESESQTVSSTIENKPVADMLSLLDELIKKTDEYDSYGLWHVAGYFMSDDMSSAEIAASNYRSLMNGERSGREVAAINSWRSYGSENPAGFQALTTYLSRFVHPRFSYGGGVVVDASTSVSGKELGLHLGLPRATVPGLPVVEHAEFGKEVTTYQLIPTPKAVAPEDRITIGRIFDLGQVTNKIVELDNRSLNMHTFVTGSTGSGKSNAVYQMLAELRQDKIPFLVVEPAKGEYKDAFGSLPDVNVFSTNPNVARLVNLNPFMFPKSIHVLEHVDGLVEIFGVCWPMYDAMPAFFKDAILKSYEVVGWDLGSSTFEGDQLEFPDFEVLAEQLDELISGSDYASDIKSNYRGALLTRVRSLTVGLNKYIFTMEQTPYEELFDKNCVLDISRVKSGETKALIMGLIVYALNEYRVDQKSGNNNGLKHITVLEEAHNLLKNTTGGASELVGKSVEMITNTIAEIRTYGEGFVIVDQSPSSVDIAAIKNTNTKIILRTPEANDRIAVGRSVGLTDAQVDEIAKLPSGVAVVYQNNWISPVLAMIDKAAVDEKPYEAGDLPRLMTQRSARKLITRMLMQPWFKGKGIKKATLLSAQKVLELKRSNRIMIKSTIEDYDLFNCQLIWRTEDIPKLQTLLIDVLDINDKQLSTVKDADDLRALVQDRLGGMKPQEVNDICFVLTYRNEG
ncbi:MAG: ATP-binding protein [Atopobiaceae bacterium]|nr:ATP-binding protein [Atopobiaceae bacterium]